MSLGACSREREVSELLSRGHWPQACAPELRAHVGGCRRCGDLVLVTEAFHRERAVAASAARLQSHGLLWWRAQLRRRNAAIERISRPFVGAQVFALVVTVVAAAAIFVSQARHGLGWMSWLGEIPRALRIDAFWSTALPRLEGSFWFLIPAVATLLFLSGVVVYLTSEKQ